MVIDFVMVTVPKPPASIHLISPLMLVLLIVVGLYRVIFQDLGQIPASELSEEARELAEGTTALTVLMLLRAFSSGAVALSGVEAISNGVQAFRKPESRNAAITLMWTAFILGSLFVGIAVLAGIVVGLILALLFHVVFG